MRHGDRVIPVELARYVAERNPDATMVELNSADHLIWFSDTLDVLTDEIQDFIIGALPNREIATVVFVDDFDPGRPTPRPGHAEARRLIDRFRGHTVRHGDEGILVMFDGPARAIRCACCRPAPGDLGA